MENFFLMLPRKDRNRLMDNYYIRITRLRGFNVEIHVSSVELCLEITSCPNSNDCSS